MVADKIEAYLDRMIEAVEAGGSEYAAHVLHYADLAVLKSSDVNELSAVEHIGEQLDAIPCAKDPLEAAKALRSAVLTFLQMGKPDSLVSKIEIYLDELLAGTQAGGAEFAKVVLKFSDLAKIETDNESEKTAIEVIGEHVQLLPYRENPASVAATVRMATLCLLARDGCLGEPIDF